MNWWTYPSDPDVFPYYHSSAAGKGFNIPGYQDAKLDDLLVQGQGASDLEARKAAFALALRARAWAVRGSA